MDQEILICITDRSHCRPLHIHYKPGRRKVAQMFRFLALNLKRFASCGYALQWRFFIHNKTPQTHNSNEFWMIPERSEVLNFFSWRFNRDIMATRWRATQDVCWPNRNVWKYLHSTLSMDENNFSRYRCEVHCEDHKLDKNHSLAGNCFCYQKLPTGYREILRLR